MSKNVIWFDGFSNYGLFLDPAELVDRVCFPEYQETRVLRIWPEIKVGDIDVPEKYKNDVESYLDGLVNEYKDGDPFDDFLDSIVGAQGLIPDAADFYDEADFLFWDGHFQTTRFSGLPVNRSWQYDKGDCPVTLNYRDFRTECEVEIQGTLKLPEHDSEIYDADAEYLNQSYIGVEEAYLHKIRDDKGVEGLLLQLDVSDDVRIARFVTSEDVLKIEANNEVKAWLGLNE